MSTAKERVRHAMNWGPVPKVLRSINSAPWLSEPQRAAMYRRVTRSLPSDPDRLFRHRVPGGGEMSIHLDGTIRRLYWTGTYETDALPYFAAYASDADAILDVGAAEGVYSLFAAAVNPTAAILSFEASARQLARLQANHRANPLLAADRWHLVSDALSDEVGTALFYEVPGGTSSLNPEFRPGSQGREVPVVRGDSVVAERLAGRRVELIKVDTESTEPAVLRGLRETIERDRPVLLCEVLSGRTEDELQVLIDEWGYRSYQLEPEGPARRERIVGDPTHRAANWLFLPDDRPPRAAASIY